MDAGDEPDIAGIFAPVDVMTAVQGGVLGEAEAALLGVTDPVDAELWGSDIIGALTAAAGDEAEAMAALTGSLMPAAEEAATPTALAVLKIFSVLGSAQARRAAAGAARRVAAAGVAEPLWAATVGSPQVGHCWHYADLGGRQESLTMTFAYGDWIHEVSLLLDHGQGGKIKDVWVAKDLDLLAATQRTAGSDPLVVFEMLDAGQARQRLDRALAAGECPEVPDQADDINAHRALLHARLDLLSRETP
jgi:hypothetical protein